MPTTLNLFISYAREDEIIANAVRAALANALPTPPAFVDMDKYTIEVGADFSAEIKKKLNRAHVLVLVHTARPKESFGWTGQELGYFRAQQEITPKLDEIERRIVFVSLAEDVPPGTEMLNGIRITISSKDLDLTKEEYANRLRVTDDDTFVQFLNQMQGVVEEIWRRDNYPGVPPTRERDHAEFAKDMYVEIFGNLKASVDVNRSTRPQKQLTIDTSDTDLDAHLPDLPPSAQLTPGSAGGLGIFGLPEASLTWTDFCAQTQGRKNGSVWTGAIRAVVTSTLPNQVSVDNGQVIFAHDDGKMYRVILTSGLRYFDGRRRFTIYLVEGLARTEFGREETSLLLKGLELVCRYRFMFLEADSPFVYENIEVTRDEDLHDRAASVMRELDWLKRDARQARLDDTVVWARMLRGYDLVKKMAKAYGENEPAVIAAANAVLRSRTEPLKLPELRAQLAGAIRALAEATDDINRRMMVRLMGVLKRYIDEEKAKVRPVEDPQATTDGGPLSPKQSSTPSSMQTRPS
ncbi:toll/interleukin-1 receptor domain-containing protein [Aquabacterium humicola]|uniref:toll/interleukin-1 receptor domain-containing protein n=1 Tax=Aquabacterium humicola TaxID=3237377 RepID=UPI0025428F94|nr:toll/interleukin-1 receptor domain-containing protein [Rubrivivax pictus]